MTADSTVKERPILMSAPMVMAILDGKKTQTRRVVSRRAKDDGEWVTITPRRGFTPETIAAEYPCPYGAVGDRLWVRETWHCPRQFGGSHQREKLIFRAEDGVRGDYSEVLWAPSIFMPRWASRITLEITGVRVERVQEISTADCWAEGIEPPFYKNARTVGGDRSVRVCYEELWDSLNAKRGYGWDKNPWVWVLNFKRIPDDR